MATYAIQRHKLWSVNTPPLILFLASILLGALAGCGGGGGGGSGGGNDTGAGAGGSASDPAADPGTLTLSATPDDGEVVLQWSVVNGSDEYTLYYATAGEIQPANFGIWASQHGGVMVANVTSPHTVQDLDNGTRYFFVVTTMAGGEEGPPSNEVSAIPERSPAGLVKLNDTGINWCADRSNNFLRCPVSGYPRQDAELGRDAAARAGALEKVGAGDSGFDFTKIANDGSELPASATLGDGPNDWACTRDNVTGLIWEVKTDDDGLRRQSGSYFWYQPEGPNMGDPGSPRPRGTTTGIWPNTHQFIQEVNEKGLCGAKDWRLPAVSELHSISHGGAPISQRGPDPDFMPNLPAQVWSADSDAGFPANAWLVNTASGHDETEGKNRLSRGVVLVRGGP